MIIQTYSGHAFNIAAPKIDDLHIHDIAHALAMQSRYNGHARHFYSIAQHSVLCSYLVQPQNRLAALMHDAAEAYVGDVVSPLKRHLRVSFDHLVRGTDLSFDEVEDEILRLIGLRFGFDTPLNADVKQADMCMFWTEVRDILTNPMLEGVWDLPPRQEPMSDKIQPWNPEYAEHRFIERFIELKD